MAEVGIDRYAIITLAELNKRSVKDAFYPTIAEFERCVANLIQEEYPNSEELATSGLVGRRTKDAWEANSDVHISEFFNLSDMSKIV